ncbi:MAG: DUF4288 domain-containing protein, partial [Chitinophagaceae bacterium]
WYLATIIYRILCMGENITPQFDEQVRIIYAEDKLDAFHKARRIGHQEEDSFLNDAEKPVRWQFVDITSLVKMDTNSDGAEIFSRVHEIENAALYLKKINQYAAAILEDSLQEIPQVN